MSSARQRFQVTLEAPDGARHDVTARTDLDSLGTLTEAFEEDLTELTHPDMDVTLFDADGWAAALFLNAQRTDVYRFELDRKHDGGYERIFTGVVDVPAIRIDRREGEVGLTVLGLGKLLELEDAGAVCRELLDRTGSVSASSKVVTVSDTDGLEPSDEITLSDGVNDETQTIATVDSSTQVTTVEAWDNAFSSAELTLVTPYYRSKTVSFLAGELFALAGISDVTVEIDQELSQIPFPSAMNVEGLPGGVPTAMLERSTNWSVWLNSNRYDAADPVSAFSSGGGDSPKADWRPYKTSEPGTLRACGSADDGSRAVDYDTGDYYELTVDGGTDDLELEKNGVFLVTVQDGTISPSGWYRRHLDFNEMEDEIWVGYTYVREVAGIYTIINNTKVYNSSGTLLRTLTGLGGWVRCLAPLGRFALHRWLLNDEGQVIGWAPIEFYDGSALDGTIDSPGLADLWTLRADADHIFCMTGNNTTGEAFLDGYVTVWSRATGAIIAAHQLSSAATSRRASLFDNAGVDTPIYCCHVWGGYFIVSEQFSGVVPYADFEDLSAAAALRALALLSVGYVWVDEFGAGWLLARRASLLQSRDPIDLGDPLESSELPLSEWHRTGCTVEAEAEDGTDIEVSRGSTGKSANALELSIELPLTEGFAAAIAETYVAYLSSLGRQRDETVREPTTGRVRPLDIVRHSDGQQYRVLRVESALEVSEQTLQMVAEG